MLNAERPLKNEEVSKDGAMPVTDFQAQQHSLTCLSAVVSRQVSYLLLLVSCFFKKITYHNIHHLCQPKPTASKAESFS